MGVVYKARQRSLHRVVALKLLLSGRFASKESIQRLRAEAAAAAVLSHPNIVAVHEAGEIDGQHYFSMNYIAGRNLAEMVHEGPVPARRAAKYVCAIAEAIHYAHQHGVLHRDLKPSNVLIDQDDQPRITDFGLAKRLDEESDLTVSGKAIGSPSFMPPEQARGHRREIGPASDIYSLGALLYHLLTGRAPFVAETMEATLVQVLHVEPVPVRRLNPDVPVDLETICLRCLEKESHRRYATARDLAEDLRRFENDEPIQARPVTALKKLRRWAGRNRGIAFLTSTLVLVFLTGLTAVSWQWRRAELHIRIELQQKKLLENELASKEIQAAEASFASGDASSALARLALVVRNNPSNEIATTRLLSALASRSFPIPVTEPLTHNDAVLSARFSPDGRTMVTASADGSARVWDAWTGRQLLELRHNGAVRYAEFSPDERRIVTASEDATARVWDARTGQPVTPFLRHRAKVRRASFSPDGSQIVTASADATAQIWDSRTGAAATPPLRHAKYVIDAVYSPDGRRIATSSEDDTCWIWDARTGGRLTGPLRHDGNVWSARFSPDGTRVVTASGDNTARVWDARTGQPVTGPLKHGQMVNFASFSPDGTRVVTASWDDTARVWDAATGEPLPAQFEFDSDVLYAEFSPDGGRLFTIADEAARVWNAATGVPVTEMMIHEAPLRHLGGFSPDGSRVVTTSLDKTAIIWDARPGGARPQIFIGQQASRALSCSPDGRWLAAARGSRFVAHVWEAASGHIVAGPLHHGGPVVATTFSPDGKRLLTACRDGTAHVWKIPSGEPAFSPLVHDGIVNSVQFSPDGKRIVTASWDKTARIWDAATGRELTPPLRHDHYVQWAEFSPDNQRVVTASGDHTARVWNAATGALLTPPLRHRLGLQSARFSPDGRRIVTASEDGTGRIWDAASSRPLGRPLTHRGHVRMAAFSPDGRRVVTTSLDNTARVWDAETGEPISEPLKHASSVHAAQFSPDSRILVTMDYGSETRLFDAASGHLLFEPLRHPGRVEAAAFLPDGNRLATVGSDRQLRIWDIPRCSTPAPDWLAELAEAIAAKRFDALGRSVPVNAGNLARLRERLLSNGATDPYSLWGRWFFADRGTRNPSPFPISQTSDSARPQ